MTKFVHLHLHTEYSLLDGLSKIKRLFSYVKEKKMDAVAITDHGAMYGAIDFFKEGKKQEVKPIIGMEAYMTNFPLDDEKKVKDNYHLTLLAKDYQGYKNLMNLTSIAHLKGYYYRPRFTKDILEKYSKGIICLSGCPQAEVPQYLINGEFKKAKETTEWFLKVFGKDYFLEIQRHSFDKILPSIKVPELKESLSQIADNYVVYEKGIVKLSRELGIPLVATNDAHYIKKEDAEAQDALVCIATGKNTSDIKRMRYIDNPDFFIKDPEEMQKMFPDYPDALENTVKIAEKCNLEIPLGSWSFPKFNLPEGLTDKKYIEKLAWEKLPIKLGKVTKEAEERLTHELDIINNKGYAPYFLIVMDMVNWCGSQGIITNTRGSAAGSLVSYVLGITTVNPLTYGLPFERFLNPYRPSPPDIDFDVSDNRREEVLKYIADTYGVEKTAQICTFGRMLAKAAVRDVARVLGYPYITGDKVAKLIPLGSQGFPMTIDRALNETPDLKTLYDNDADTKKIIDLARQVEGNARHLSVHAAGVVVAPSNLTDFAPIQREPSGEKIITQYEMHACEDVGLIKFDILGIRNLSILGSAIQIVKKQKEIDINLLNLPLNDKKTFEMLSRGETMGTFQLNGSGMTKFLKDLKPARIEDLMAMVALYRPGPMAVIPEYIARKNNHKLIKYLDPRMEKFLKMSYGLIVYQDDLLFCALDLAGYTWEEADKFRKAVGKKIPEEMAAQKEKFIKGIIEHGQTQKFAEKLWTLFEPFQAYGFNKAHAASYGMVAYYTSYMKANYPIEYMTALLTAESDDSDKISAAVHECRRMKINVLPPDINESDVDFSIVDGAIRFGLSAIKNVGNVAIQIILEARQDGPFNSFSDFINRVDARKVNKKVLESLIKVGAMQKFGKRTALLASVDEIKSKLVKPKENNGQSGLFSEEDSLKTSAIVNDVSFIDNTIPEYTEDEIQNLERELLGFSLSGKPINELLEKLELQATHKIFELNPDEQRGKIVKVAVVVREVRKILTKKSNAEMAFVKVEDTTGILDLVVFPKIFQETKDHWVDGKPLIICGKVDSREDTTNMLVDSISLGEIDNSIVIKIPKTIGKDELLMLKQIFQENPGDIETTLLFEKDNRKIKPKLKIKWSDNLSKQISEILKQNL
ncbi:DNA polymerase III subunit alpha [Candidatus Woesebacteria bacterium RIFOXYC1_FULL_31_51]|uniref:DNA polymerase III subunit alpha n=1 Tax=Candidatus Woesebacteria bacterium GW2011_GWC2_31_9 TaxID=1618586 RepID=A0A0G0AZE8_9BACT|nr:MAG: polymerase III subunit alpha, DNA polymerase III subunit alpha protein [Candidatus Woesebacteria bacterium GW2011_GWF1_31_35]KKP23645.1 MAG: polymerase III, alpha subunit protein [Candidatus Woesebacteria bacterium GW2011_GWC1_30_29]KKP26974.1 MAG: polymerase III, alpha subunit protein [Candidatus Woesebacteria bacterium GW2011_GWD1_31_12]KKP27920.1 MAG: polymerase III, alpha subunit protein [Candidatus Woesebacteria bacterium GW2011_GWB1_31_29]KKP31925.1 MAG: polymerase III, alpha subu